MLFFKWQTILYPVFEGVNKIDPGNDVLNPQWNVYIQCFITVAWFPHLPEQFHKSS